MPLQAAQKGSYSGTSREGGLIPSYHCMLEKEVKIVNLIEKVTKIAKWNAKQDGNMNASEIAQLLRANPMLDPSEIDEFLTTFAR